MLFSDYVNFLLGVLSLQGTPVLRALQGAFAMILSGKARAEGLASFLFFEGVAVMFLGSFLFLSAM